MRHRATLGSWLVAPALLVAVGPLGGCESAAPESPSLRPVRSETVSLTTGGRARTFSGTARAGQETDLSFRVGGSIELLTVSVGDRVSRNQLIARLEQTDYEIAVRRAEAGLEQASATARNATADLERIRGLWENQNTSRNELDQALAQAQSAQAAVEVAEQSLAQARRQLSYTDLRAPLDGSIAAVPVEANENVQPGQTIARLTSGSRPEVEVAIPELLISRIEQGAPVTVTVSALPGRRFAAAVSEVGVAATGLATTFPVTVRLHEVEGVRSGMAADVTFVIEEEDPTARILVPSHAVGEDRDGTFVFLLEEHGEPGVGVVRRTAVGVGSELTPEGRLEIRSGLTAGQRIVTAGVRRLVDGQRVKLLGDGSHG